MFSCKGSGGRKGNLDCADFWESLFTAGYGRPHISFIGWYSASLPRTLQMRGGAAVGVLSTKVDKTSRMLSRVTLYRRVTMNVKIVKGHKSLWLIEEGLLQSDLTISSSSSSSAPSFELEVVSFPELLIKLRSTGVLNHFKQRNSDVCKGSQPSPKV